MYGDCLCSSMNCILLMLYNKNANVWAPVSIQSCKLQNLLLLQFIWYEDRTLQKYLVSAEVWSCWGDYEFNNYFSGNRLWIQGFGYVCLEWNAHFFPFHSANNRNLYQRFCETAQKDHLGKMSLLKKLVLSSLMTCRQIFANIASH